MAGDYNNSALTEYESLVDRLILQSLGRDGTDFAHLLVSLPGIYPSTVLERLQFLAFTAQLDELQYRRLFEDSRRLPTNKLDEAKCSTIISLPIEHPLDYEWRFGEKAARLLLSHAASLSHNGKPIVMLGAPTILRYALETGYNSPAVLIDKNPLMADCFSRHPKARVHNCDLLKDPLPKVQFSVVIIDPPWYSDYMRTFVWAGVELSVPQSHLLLSAPPAGTRPNVDFEMAHLLAWMKEELGLTLVGIEKGVLPYQTPLFEKNALGVEGIANVPREWRKGDLWVMRSTSDHGEMPRPIVTEPNSSWRESVLGDVRLKVRDVSCRSSSVDPSLKLLVPGDVLPSVSRRDKRREAVDVWTSGNRVFRCSAPQLLHEIAEALANGLSPYDAVCCSLEKDLTELELSKVGLAIEQLTQLVTEERSEISYFTNMGTHGELVFHSS